MLESIVEMKEVLLNSSRDITVPSSSVNDALEVTASCLLNVASAAGDSAQIYDSSKSEEIGNNSRDTVSIASL